MFEVNNRNTRTRCEICSKLTVKIPERRHWRRSGIFIANFEHILHLVLMFLLLTLSMEMATGEKLNFIKCSGRTRWNYWYMHGKVGEHLPLLVKRFLR